VLGQRLDGVRACRGLVNFHATNWCRLQMAPRTQSR
jgi:hypothetical protein